MLRGLLIGLPLGLALGWLLFDGDEPPPAREAPPMPERPRRTAHLPRLAPDMPPRRVAAAEVRDAGVEELLRIPANAELADETVAALVERIDEAREQRDWTLFATVLQILGRAGTPEAHGKLVQLMGDRSLDFGARMDRAFLNWLDKSDAPGLVAAAKRRAGKERDKNPRATFRQAGWLALVALHGTDEDLDWLAAFRGARGGERAVLDALTAAAARPKVARRLATLFQERRTPWSGAHIARFAGRNPAVARPLLEAGLRDAPEEEQRELARVYGATATPETRADTVAFLRGLKEPNLRMQAAFAVQEMQRNGIDVSDLEDLARYPVDHLETIASGPKWDYRGAMRAVRAIERNPLTWSQRAAEILELAAQKAPNVAKRHFQRALEKVRDAVATKNTDWDSR